MGVLVAQHPASFRDPGGYVVYIDGVLCRIVSRIEQENYDTFMSSGLYEQLNSKGLLISHKEDNALLKKVKNNDAYKIIKPELVPFISYPYEWSFSQLKDAALLTLEIAKISLQKDMILKDASAYNIQFVGSKPIFIDSSSFAKWSPGDPWDGYKQFCQHFIAPLAVMAYGDQYLHRMSRIFIDGIPLDIASKILSNKLKFKPGLLQHLFIHASSQTRYDNTGSKHVEKGKSKANVPNMTKYRLLALTDSLTRTIKSIKTKKRRTEWGNYYDFTNYSASAFGAKHKIVEKMVKKVNPKTVWDLGANDGEFSQIPASMGTYTISFDIDPNAVNNNYSKLRGNENVLPLLIDITNPSPGIGWASKERSSLVERGPAEMVFVLALIHHISISNNVPFDRLAAFLAECGKHILIEFVPKEDSKVQTLLSTRKDIFVNYNEKYFESIFGKYFSIVEKTKIPKSKRTLYLLKTR